MKKLLHNSGRLLAAGLLLFTISPAQAQLEFDVDASLTWNGYMNVFDNTEEEAFLWGNPWGVPDLKTVIDTGENTITLYPNYNTYNATDPYWANGEEGNKIVEATTFLENLEWAGQDVTFKGHVESNTLSGDFVAVAFVKALNPDNAWSLDVYVTAELIDGENFTITVPADQLPEGLMVQYGFSVRGLNANPTQEASNGNIVVKEFDTTSGVNEFNTTATVLYPNPANDVLNISSQNMIGEVNIFNMLGQKVMNTTSDAQTLALNISSLNSGVYIVNTTSEGKETSTRFVKK